MKIGTVWDAKVTHLNYVLKGKVTTIDDLSFTINDVVLVSGNDDHYIPKVGDLITVELTTEVIMSCVFEVGTIHLRFAEAVITGIDKCNNLCVTVNLSAEQLTKHLTDHLYETFGIKKHES